MKSLEMSNGPVGSEEGKKTCEEMVKFRSYDIILRTMGLVFTLVAAVVAGTNKDIESVPISLVDGLPPLHLTLTAKWNYVSSTVYFVTVNAVACVYAATSIAFPALTGGRRGTNWKDSVLVALDLTIVALLFSANGASAAVGVIALNGNFHTQWHKVCNAFKRYCIQGGAALAMSMLGSFFFIFLVLLFTFNLHRTTLNY